MSSFNQLIEVARTSMASRMQDLDNTSNNFANITTVGYKQSRMNFNELLEEATLEGVKISASQKNMSQGAMRNTQNPLDMYIQGDGFFGVKMADGRTAYTRNGEFQLDANMQIQDGVGDLLDWQGTLPEGTTNVDVHQDGSIYALVGDTWSNAGTVNLYKFINPSGLSGYGNNLWLETESSGAPGMGTPGQDGFGQLKGSVLEGSNVSLSEEYSHLISLQRSFQVSVRNLKMTDTMIGQAIRMRQA